LGQQTEFSFCFSLWQPPLKNNSQGFQKAQFGGVQIATF
jgi:hypothetical protein